MRNDIHSHPSPSPSGDKGCPKTVKTHARKYWRRFLFARGGLGKEAEAAFLPEKNDCVAENYDSFGEEKYRLSAATRGSRT